MNKTPTKRRVTAKEAARRAGLSERTIRNYAAQPRNEWLAEKAAEREAIRAYHDDKEHSWTQTAKHFSLSVSTVRERARRARKERERKEIERIQIPLPLDEIS